jgi:hypothetical protein
MPGVTLYANVPSAVITSGGTDAPASGTTETWTADVATAFPVVSASATPPTLFHVADEAPGADSEIVLVTSCPGGTGSQSWLVTRGAEGTTPVPHAAGFAVSQVATAGDLAALQVLSDVFNVRTNGGAKGDGVTDDTTALAALNSYVNPSYGAEFYFPLGQYVTNAPLVFSQGDTFLFSDAPLATMGGGSYNDGKLVTIKPGAGWAQGSANAPACILFDGSAGAINKCGITAISVLGSNVPSGTVMHGIATLGQVGAFGATGCIIGSISNTSSDGITNLTGTLPTAQGGSYMHCLVQAVGGHGFNVASGDMTMEDCHAQGCGLWGIMVTIGAGDTRLSDCRSDLSTNNGGFYIYVPASAYLAMVQLSNCTTQRNNTNGIQIANTSAGNIGVVYLDNCVFQGDGIGGGGDAGIRLSGPVAAVITGGGVLVNTIDIGSGVPLHAITTASDGVSPPVALNMRGGFYNGVTGFWDNIQAPLTYDIRVHAWTGSQWVYTDTPSVWNSGDNTSANSNVLTPTFANGTAAQLSDTAFDYMVYLTATSSGTGFSLKIGPTSTPANTIITGAVIASGQNVSFRVPAGWYVEWAATSAAFGTQSAVRC